jgi:hypothetical protein
MKNLILITLFFLCISVADAQPPLTTSGALYFSNSGNAPDGFPYARFTENYGIRFSSPDSRWVFSSKPSVLIGYAPSGENWGNDNLLVYGKVGIGTTNAMEKLTVMGNVHLPLGNSLGFIQSTDYFTHDGKAVGNYSLGWYNDSWQGGAPSSYYSGYGGIKFFTQANPRMSIDYWGNVGVGTTYPQAKFEVGSFLENGGLGTIFGRLQEGHTSGTGTFLGVRGYETQPTGAKSFALEHSFYGEVNNSINFHRGGGTTGGFISFNTDNNVEKLRINSNGNVGIGTTNPDAKLAVKGTVHAEEVKVDLQVPGPDYVFEPTYQLPSLTEIENYIKANKHLPEVPSAKEMETNGINLSEMNMLLLKKVEELTLHLIEANKKIEYLTKRIDEKN